ncbi:hypothetical protein BT67DRAFT_437063 [Trichocladium antarcticum]|uniref:Uncharacterized protein n=1 Tax=Trichocladium antarcticum TaxID=1450529 RepID=A0AAN6UEV9_9PEZI|nr:hypothetical protein BT67DRAFT_437063 [Trichocladium antarcticum]
MLIRERGKYNITVLRKASFSVSSIRSGIGRSRELSSTCLLLMALSRNRVRNGDFVRLAFLEKHYTKETDSKGKEIYWPINLKEDITWEIRLMAAYRATPISKPEKDRSAREEEDDASKGPSNRQSSTKRKRVSKESDNKDYIPSPQKGKKAKLALR